MRSMNACSLARETPHQSDSIAPTRVLVQLAFVERAGTRDRDLNWSQAAIVTASQMRKERPRSSR